MDCMVSRETDSAIAHWVYKLDPFDPDGVGVGIVYLNAEHWVKNPAFPEHGVRTLLETEILTLIKAYDPDREIVLMLLSSDGNLRTRRLSVEDDSPPAAYQRWSGRAANCNDR